MSLDKSWLPIGAAAAVGGILAFGVAALVSLASGEPPRAAPSIPAANAPLPVAAQVARQPDPTKPDGSIKPLHSVDKPRKVPEPSHEIATAPAVELREFKHVLLRPASYMKMPEARGKLHRDFIWKADGEIPAGELVRYRHSPPYGNSLCVVERTSGSHVLLQYTSDLLRESWRLEVTADTRQLADTRNAFAWDLYHQYREQPGNLFFSPGSIAEALSMVLAGARGETAAEISRALKLDQSPADVHATGADLRKLLVQPDRHRGFELLIANRAWAQQGFSMEQPFTNLLGQHYGAEMGLADFKKNRDAARHEMNAWISEQTKGHLPEVIMPADIDDLTRLVLVNAVYFLGDWDVPFKKELTQDAPFFLGDNQQKPVPMMHRRARLPYYHGSGFQAASIPYGKGQLAMVLIVPAEVEGLVPLEATLSRQTVDNLMTGMKPQNVELALPRLEMRSRLDLAPALKNLGMDQAFDPVRADFSGMHIPNGMVDGDRLFVQSAIHEATVKIDEEGTVAAAATVFAMAGGVAPLPPPQVRADRPFIFLIRDQLTGSVLFIGRVLDPT
ncbi:MAG: serpin family protein [Pirellulaceae bacterium]